MEKREQNQKEATMDKMYMNAKTGSVDTRDGWEYVTDQGEKVNAVDRDEVVEVIKDAKGEWVEA
jgi:hypothetical protein